MYQESAHGSASLMGCRKVGRLVSSKTTGTTWVIPTNGLQMFRATCLKTGRFELAGGSRPDFNPETALYATSDMVSNVCAANNITIHGDTASKRRFMACQHAWKSTMSLDELIAHPYLGKTMPKRDVIVAAYANMEEIEA